MIYKILCKDSKENKGEKSHRRETLHIEIPI
jgi:hypothetical protein